jgi:hypothetical protein
MQKNTGITPDALRKSVVEHMILSYYNDQLLATGCITEREHRQMRHKILSRKPIKNDSPLCR